LFSGLEQTLFHADPHAGNLQLSAGPSGNWRVVVLDWSQAGRLSASTRHALIELCLDLFQGKPPSGELLVRLLGAPYQGAWKWKGAPRGENPLEKALALLEQMAIEGQEVPLDLLLFRKALLTLEGILKQLDPRFDLWQQTLRYAGWVLASETPFRLLSLPIPWLDTPDFYRSGIPTRWMLARGAEEFVRLHNFGLTASPFLCEFAPAQAVLKRSRQQKQPRVFGEHP
jgi:ubiquinone biosynthesis protein